MSNKAARFASAISIGVLVALSPITAFFGAARAADTCLSEPNGATPAGKHWYYRIEHGTGRHCWYLRGEDEKPASVGASGSAPAVTEASPRAETDAARSIANAHAELPSPVRAAETTTAAVTPAVPTAPAEAAGSVPANGAAALQATSPWPAPSSLAQGSQDAATASEERADSQPTPVPEPAVAQPAQAVERKIGSLQKLLLVAFGALALAGLSGSAVYRSAAGARRRRARRKDRWPKKMPAKVISRAVSAPTSNARRVSAPELADDVHLPPGVAPELDDTTPRRIAPSARDESEYPGERVERIEDFLARLTKQLQAEMENARAR
jgi:hypothetical protein